MTQQPGHHQYGDPQFGQSGYGDPRYGNQPPAVGPDDRTPAALAHASSLIAMALSAGWLSFVGPLVMWLIYKDRSPFVRQAAAGSFNFNLGLWIMSIVGWIFILTVIGLPIGLILLAVSFLAQIIGHVIGTVRATQGRTINYPFQLRVLR
ncbi:MULTISPECIES: DUF4870 domain-containing protein [Dietzia]|uniref:DUF4870 domain-containing protein n=1 Tax=Dietzia TaxID=37914 RepID=UPI002DBD3476|nr:DUF4870 domain-containing protein [Dietzia kunjamensis]MEB8325252.1 DUF4870 domain-containing protein [Dietzia kunjamensis]